jgi:hypothetical protein
MDRFCCLHSSWCVACMLCLSRSSSWVSLSSLSFLSRKKRDFAITFLTSLLSISPPIIF